MFAQSRLRLSLFVVLVAALSLAVVGHAQDRSVINVYTGSDTNISDWWSNTIIPAFEAAQADYTVNLVLTGDSGGNFPIAQRTLAALEAGADPQVDYFEQFDPLDFPESIEAGLWAEFNEETVPNFANVIEAAQRSPYGMAYRGSQVLLAYNSEVVPEDEVPHSYAELVEWIKAHPGQFVYSRPDRGGSGGNFVVRAIYEVNGQDTSLFTPETFDPDTAEELFGAAWDLLREIHPYIYENGSYTAGNTPAVQLLANGSVSMISAWSDQAIQSIRLGVLPESTRLVQLSDMAFPGGYAVAAIPNNAANLEGALALANFVLTPEMQASVVQDIGGFPAVSWDVLPAELQAEFSDVITSQVPFWPGGDWSAAMNDGWYENVATNVLRESD